MNREDRILTKAAMYVSTNWETNIPSILIECFKKGAEWADNHPISPWISVEDDLPCNHEELMVKDEKGRWETKRVLVRIQETGTSFKRPYFADCMMSKWDGEESGFLWHLCSQGYITHWMPIPELPIGD